jgi:8-oxo-dGTP pyrophosphatase MutT (NUDIX family)
MRAARREVFEETGVSVEIQGFLGMWLDEYGNHGKGAKRTLNIYYHAVPTRPGATVAEHDPAEVLEVGSFSALELPENLAFPGHVPAVLRAWHRAVKTGQLETPLFDGEELAR